MRLKTGSVSVEQTLELFYQKRDLVTNILSFTKEAKFKGTKEEIEEYINLIEQRQQFVEKLMQIENALKTNEHIENIKSNDISEKVEKIELEIKEDIIFLSELENRNMPLAQKMLILMKSEMKNFKTSKKASSMYNQDLFEGYTKIDTLK
ncbi:MAG: hypothetical protein FWF57_02975 [Defluviitaleaceae bacterium]|nr:hypothetical protein [Defluviitaleaceae bacterium]